MKYRHSFHAGNFADVHKHITLLALIDALARKDKGFLYVDTHAGRGLYPLGGDGAAHESRHGIGALKPQAELPAEIAHYLSAVKAVRDAAGDAQLYPGSAVLAACALRPQDRGVCFELQSPECRALERALAPYARMRAECADGLKGLTAVLPPAERRALVLIDPPYEDPSADTQSALAAVQEILRRLPNSVIALWYPIKDERALAPWFERLRQALAATPCLISELWLHPRDSRVALNGSGLVLINPPYQFDVRLAQWLPQLARALQVGSEGGSASRWLVHESA
ncbi:MAG: 23S rRNA (adenine(2030)-N(6))-methyltransferase RlmJ [Steroidobacteraceae bacterium]|jgi:23S rRNA (adenine2030-N6)-methyltransferase